MMEHTTDRLFWTLTAVIIGALLLTIAIKAFPGVANGIMDRVTSVMGTASNTAKTAGDAASQVGQQAMSSSYNMNPSAIASLF